MYVYIYMSFPEGILFIQRTNSTQTGPVRRRASSPLVKDRDLEPPWCVGGRHNLQLARIGQTYDHVGQRMGEPTDPMELLLICFCWQQNQRRPIRFICRLLSSSHRLLYSCCSRGTVFAVEIIIELALTSNSPVLILGSSRLCKGPSPDRPVYPSVISCRKSPPSMISLS